MKCQRRKFCKTDKSFENKNSERILEWMVYPSPEIQGFGHGKFCCFVSCRESDLPIRNYIKGKPEPCYENKTYNECAFCNQKGIRNLKKKGVSYIIFVTKYQGKLSKFRNKFYITGWFPISKYVEIPEEKRNMGKIIYKSRIAYKSCDPIFLSMEDRLIELNEKRWKEWFPNKPFPKNKNFFPPRPQLNYFSQILERNSKALEEIKFYFEAKKYANKIEAYVKEIKHE